MEENGTEQSTMEWNGTEGTDPTFERHYVSSRNPRSRCMWNAWSDQLHPTLFLCVADPKSRHASKRQLDKEIVRKPPQN